MSEPTPTPSASGLPDVSAIKDVAPPADPIAAAILSGEKADADKGRVTQSHLDDWSQNRGEREKYAGRVFWLVVIWLFALGAIILFQGFRFRGFALSEAVMLALVGSTTVSVIGIFLIVANYLFPRGPGDK